MTLHHPNKLVPATRNRESGIPWKSLVATVQTPALKYGSPVKTNTRTWKAHPHNHWPRARAWRKKTL